MELAVHTRLPGARAVLAQGHNLCACMTLSLVCSVAATGRGHARAAVLVSAPLRML